MRVGLRRWKREQDGEPERLIVDMFRRIDFPSFSPELRIAEMTECIVAIEEILSARGSLHIKGQR